MIFCLVTVTLTGLSWSNLLGATASQPMRLAVWGKRHYYGRIGI